jgi:predicted transposase/invertase (TIGR01784 family)
MARYLDPKNDVVFKKIFGQHPHLLISFLNSQLTFADGSKIESIKYLPAELLPEMPLKKRSIVDVRCKDSNGRQFIVEMQMEWVTAFFERMLYNTARLYGTQLQKGDTYLKLQPVYGLAILNENFDKITDEYYHQFEMLNPHNPQEKITGMNIVLIELEKFVPKTGDEKKLAILWLRFLKEIDESINEIPQELKENMLINEALELCEEAAYTDVERAEYDKYWDEIRTENTLIQGKFDEGRAKGKAEGRAEGKAEGRVEGKVEVARNLLKLGIPIEDIAKSTGFTMQEIHQLETND